MWSKWITKPLKALKEVVLIILLMLILVTMIGGVLLIAIFNVPQLSLDSTGIYWYIYDCNGPSISFSACNRVVGKSVSEV